MDGCNETKIIECGRAKIVDQATDVVDGGLRLGYQIVHEGHSKSRLSRDNITRCLGLEGERCQGRTQAVMQIAAQAAALFLARCYQTLTRTL
jgi:hypothetical protein